MAFSVVKIILRVTFLLWIDTFLGHLLEGSECNPEDCPIKQLLKPEYVTASFEHYPAIVGCHSRELTSANQQIHAVIVRRPSSSGLPGMTPDVNSSVKVIIRHNNHYTGSDKAIVVLVSTQPIMWHIHAEQNVNSSLELFLVSNNSTVTRGGRMRLKTKVLELPTDPQQLMRWMRKKWLAVTTLVEAELANVISITLGIDLAANEKCEISTHLPNVYASHIEVQVTRGCLARWNEGRDGRDVHIIELKSPTVEHITNTRHDVVIDVSSKSRPVASRHVVLILKSHMSVLWHIATHNLRGTLDIITDQSVDSNGTNTQSFRVAVESLTDYSGDELVSWTCDKYGPPVSYTEAEIANQFRLIVNGGDHLPRSRPLPSVRTPLSDHWNESNGRKVETKEQNYQDALAEAVKNQKRTIIKAIHVWCTEDNFMLTIQKRALVYHGQLPSRISFWESSCAARDNGTHYVFSTRNHACGTLNKTSHDAIAFTNAIVIEWQLGLSVNSSSISSSSSSSSFSDGSSFNSFDPFAVMINISCDYPINDASEIKEVVVNKSSDVQFRLKLFRDAAYRNEIRTFPEVLKDQDVIFVEANITADICLHVNIQNCSLEAESYTMVKEKSLIVNGCIVDKSVRWVNVDRGAARQNQHFEFRYRRFWDGSSEANLRCKLTLCTVCKSSTDPGVPLCKARDHPCGEPHVTRVVASMSSGLLQLLEVVSEMDHTVPADSSQVEYLPEKQVPEPFREHNCQQVVQIEGLSMEIVISIAFTAFIIGILLTASLWFIYVHTGRANVKNKSESNSGDSTPSSTVPITIHQIAPHR